MFTFLLWCLLFVLCWPLLCWRWCSIRWCGCSCYRFESSELQCMECWSWSGQL
jgi:hypothetical protein